MNNKDICINHECDECVKGFQLFSWSSPEASFIKIKCIREHLRKSENEHRDQNTSE